MTPFSTARRETPENHTFAAFTRRRSRVTEGERVRDAKSASARRGAHSRSVQVKFRDPRPCESVRNGEGAACYYLKIASVQRRPTSANDHQDSISPVHVNAPQISCLAFLYSSRSGSWNSSSKCRVFDMCRKGLSFFFFCSFFPPEDVNRSTSELWTTAYSLIFDRFFDISLKRWT